ncbi:PTS cellobiose transporter subunit IIC [Enterococcus faecalis]|uniref:PTS sugar transporter subunit IIB n=1 Tax=Enterococcus faecalis TaxID=1351 RepID=UPI0001F0DE3C|nr:PTS cellobiose transporter subunit IIC [Enterococcus faecalis]EFU03159.1 PTS system, Lactose/Cellobiose specific IIB subunit [Enterococcus faecalis TX0312]EGO2843344.1 PTS cellobiose transporter subunit IIC [Enterococcus faecalis]EHB6395924.1 PTS cellobiose transporter subunit IIC [Enterococcus faecalis]EHD3759752.1 PTS cellobiose transporter subunit IIC [Enterococcus faecalis]EHG5956700.1 PTS cellobiose transporter subunit IIC [Enterococcus faecalis]
MNEEKFMSKNILIICETGISASLLVSKLLEAIREKELSYDLDYAPVCRIEEKLGYKEYDVLMLTPQVARVKEKVEKYLEGRQGQVVFIDQEDFRYMNTEKILASIEK